MKTWKNPDEGKKLLLIVDPQIDFITGSLAVPGAVKAMDALANYVADHGDDYGHIVVTCDRHPLNHCSFREYGGPWPTHCVVSSVGAAIWPPLMEQLMKRRDRVSILHKGEWSDREEYSIFDTGDGKLFFYDHFYGYASVDICGLAGDVCVAKTAADFKEDFKGIEVHILEPFTATIGS